MTDNLEKETFHEWLDRGIRNKFCTEIYCPAHEVFSEGDDKFHQKELDEQGFDYCYFVTRVNMKG